MNFQNTQLLTDDIKNESSEDLNNSEVGGAIKNDCIATDNVQEKLHSSIDPKTNGFNDGADNEEIKDLAEVIRSKKLKEEVCWYNQYGERICRS